MVGHVPVPLSLCVPWCYRHVEGFLHRHDIQWRLRCSLDHPGFYVLERRVRKAPAVNAGMRLLTDAHLQACDGYLHVATIHPSYLNRPWRIVEKLKEEGADLWECGGAVRLEDEQLYEERWARETRRRKRRETLQAIGREQQRILERTGYFGTSPSRSRISNAGMPA